MKMSEFPKWMFQPESYGLAMEMSNIFIDVFALCILAYKPACILESLISFRAFKYFKCNYIVPLIFLLPIFISIARTLHDLVLVWSIPSNTSSWVNQTTFQLLQMLWNISKSTSHWHFCSQFVAAMLKSVGVSEALPLSSLFPLQGYVSPEYFPCYIVMETDWYIHSLVFWSMPLSYCFLFVGILA